MRRANDRERGAFPAIARTSREILVTEVVANAHRDPRRKLDAAAVAGRPTRHRRAAAFQLYVLGASAVFIAMAVIAHYVAYFPMDLTITRAVQGIHGDAFHRLMYGMSWIGYMPQADVIVAVTVLAAYLAGLRWEAVTTVFAASAVGIGALVKMVVTRPRPTPDLVHVLRELHSTGFPSGHVLGFTAFTGFLAFLAFTLLKASRWRTLLLVALGLLIAMMGLSRIDQGAHWFSDVMGAYVLGSLWLVLTIRLYRWGKPRFFVDQPVAAETPAPPAAGIGAR